MPTPRAHGGASLIPINLVAPALGGLNTEADASILGQEWATVLKNAIFDSAGRAAVRKGWKSTTTTPVAGIVRRIFEYKKGDATTEIIFSTDSDIFTGVVAPSSIEGSLAISEGNIKFVNFNDKCIALGTGTSGNPSVYTGTGNFTTITVNSGPAPTGGVGTSAFGRIWAVDVDGTTIRYSALLDETRWASVDGGGIIDMLKVWPSGTDVIVAIEEFAGDLVIFGKSNIVIWTDGAGSNLGIDPLVMYVSDTVPGIGCVSQFAVERAGGDLWFLSSSGLHNLVRAFQDKTTPTQNVSRNVQSVYLAYLDAEADNDDITLIHSPREDFLLTIFPSSERVVVFDTKRPLQDASLRATEWTTSLRTAHYMDGDRSLRGSLTGTVGEIMTHFGYSDGDASYDFSYESGWLDLGNELAGYLKFVKKLTSFVFVQADTTVTYTMKYDFNTVSNSVPVAVQGSPASEYSVSEYGANGSRDPDDASLIAGIDVSEYSGGVTLRAISVPGLGSGQYIKVGLTVNTANAQFALQQINLFAKVGRIAT